MSVTCQDLTRTVKALHASASCEADWRAVCSRAYYSIYQDGRAFHDALSSPGALAADSGRGMHNDLFDRLKNPTLKRENPLHKVSKQLGYLMTAMHIARVKADYSRDQDVSAHDAATSAAQVDAVLEFIATGAAPAAQPQSKPPSPSVASFGPATSHRPTLTVIK